MEEEGPLGGLPSESGGSLGFGGYVALGVRLLRDAVKPPKGTGVGAWRGVPVVPAVCGKDGVPCPHWALVEDDIEVRECVLAIPAFGVAS